MRIIFIGCVMSSHVFLKCVLEISSVDVVGIITKKSSNFNADFFSLSDIATEHSIPCLLADQCDDVAIGKWCRELNADVIYCFGWSSLLKNSILKSTRLGVVGYHPTELPKNRGRHPIIWALALGLKWTASTFFFMAEGADNGDIISQVIVPIEDEDDAYTLYKKLMGVAIKQIPGFTQLMVEKRCVAIKQDDFQANYWRKRNKKDGIIDWRMSARCIYNLVRALTKPYVGAHFEYKNQEIKVWQAEIIDEDFIDNVEPGKIVSVEEGAIGVQCGMGILRLKEFEPKIILTKGDYLL